jgi:hypothetical protein
MTGKLPEPQGGVNLLRYNSVLTCFLIQMISKSVQNNLTHSPGQAATVNALSVKA